MGSSNKARMDGRLALAIGLTSAVLAACGGGSKSLEPGGSEVARSEGGQAIKLDSGQSINQAAHNRWKEGIAAFKSAEKQGWTPDRCESVAGKFEDAAEAQAKFAEALYMAGTVHARCGDKPKALSFFQKALRQNSKFCKARVAIGLDHMESGRESAARQEFDGAVRDDPQCTEGYVNISILQRKRGETKEALNNLRRSEIINAAVKFQRAFELDPKMFEAYMNFAQITIGFRGYEDARNAFSKALELQPKSFDATVGLGVAYRGLEQNDKAEEFYNKAKQMNANRPEPYYNLGILYQDFKDGTADQAKKARAFYEQFLARAGGDERYKIAAEEIKRRCKTVKGQRRTGDKCISGRFQNIEDYLQAMKDMEEMERLQKEGEKQAAELEAQEKAAAAAAAAEAPPAEKPAEAAPAAPEGAPAAPAEGAPKPAGGAPKGKKK